MLGTALGGQALDDPADLLGSVARADQNRILLDHDDQERLGIWRQAMDASFGRVDLERLERDWLTYVDKYLK